MNHGHQAHEEVLAHLGHEGGEEVHASWRVLAVGVLEVVLAADGPAVDDLAVDDPAVDVLAADAHAADALAKDDAVADWGDGPVVRPRSSQIELVDVAAVTAAVEIAATGAVEAVVESVDSAD